MKVNIGRPIGETAIMPNIPLMELIDEAAIAFTLPRGLGDFVDRSTYAATHPRLANAVV